jgi:hypothetical protein
MEKDEIRTSCLGFGDAYNENILAAMSKVGQGQLHDADSPNDREAQLLSPPDQYDISTPSRKGLGRCFANARGTAKNENYLIEKLVLIHLREKRFVSGFQGDADPVCGSNDVELH